MRAPSVDGGRNWLTVLWQNAGGGAGGDATAGPARRRRGRPAGTSAGPADQHDADAEPRPRRPGDAGVRRRRLKTRAEKEDNNNNKNDRFSFRAGAFRSFELFCLVFCLFVCFCHFERRRFGCGSVPPTGRSGNAPIGWPRDASFKLDAS